MDTNITSGVQYISISISINPAFYTRIKTNFTGFPKKCVTVDTSVCLTEACISIRYEMYVWCNGSGAFAHCICTAEITQSMSVRDGLDR
jgi:hypothetical protein